MKHFWMLALLSLAIPASAFAQTEYSNTSATGRGGVINTFASDYQTLGVNPANLGRSSHRLSFTFLEGGFGISSGAFSKDIIRDFRAKTDHTGESLAKRKSYAQAFASDHVLNLGGELNTFAVSVHFPKIGGFAFSNRQRVLGHAGFNRNFSEFLFLGQNAGIAKETGKNELVYVADVFDGTELKASWLQEWNVAFGRTIVDLPGVSVSGGLGYRYVQGLALGEFSVKNGQVNAYGAISPTLAVDNDAYAANPLSTLLDIRKELTPVGTGHGFDIGVSAELARKVKLAVSVTDIGSIRWTENLMAGRDKGFILSELESKESNSFESALDMAEQLVNTSMEFAPQEELKTNLPTRLRLGAGLSVSRNVELGLDYVHALNDAPGNLSQDFIGVGIDVRATRHLRLSSGVSTGMGDKMNLPLGVAIVTPVYEFGLSTRDITGPLSEENPGASMAFAFLRFKLGRL